ncbi:hypothetical protein VZO05_12090 [Aggregatilineales bacterium SYSU G02658]
MQFLKRLFAPAPPKDRALVLYVKPKACNEILKVRIDTMNELSRSDDGEGFFVRKLARGQRCPFQVEIELALDRNHNILEKTITNGTEATAEEYEAFLAAQGGA